MYVFLPPPHVEILYLRSQTDLVRNQKLAYAFAPASLVAPLGSTALVANAFIAPLLNDEPLRSTDLLGVLLIALGAATFVFSSPLHEKILLPSDVLEALQTLAFQLYSLFSLLLISLLAYLSQTSYAEEYILIDVGLSAVAGGFTVISTKAISSFLNRLFLRTFQHWISWGIVIVLVGSALVQVNYINKALQRFDSRVRPPPPRSTLMGIKVVVPTQFLTFTLAAIVASAITFREFDNVPPASFLNFVFGFGLSVLGVGILTRSSASESVLNDVETELLEELEEEEEEEREEEEMMIPTESRPLLLPTSPRLRHLKSLPHLARLGKSPTKQGRKRTVSSVTIGGGNYLFVGSSSSVGMGTRRDWGGGTGGEREEEGEGGTQEEREALAGRRGTNAEQDG